MGEAPADLPPFAAWHHRGAADGFEVAYFFTGSGGLRVEGHTVAVEAGEPYSVGYEIGLDDRWRTRWAWVWGQSARGRREAVLESRGDGRWTVDGVPAPQVDGCFDVDLESSALTNAFPMHRLALAPGEAADAPAAYVRALDLAVERLDQRYVRIDDGAGPPRYDYASPGLGFRSELAYDESGLVLEYPGIATRLRV